jgi:hypothetical protein
MRYDNNLIINVISTKSGNKSHYELLFGYKPKLNESSKTFGDIGGLATKDKFQDILRNRRSICIFVGYTDNHSRGVLRMLNLETCGVINSRDVVSLNWLCKDWIIEKSTLHKRVENDDD